MKAKLKAVETSEEGSRQTKSGPEIIPACLSLYFPPFFTPLNVCICVLTCLFAHTIRQHLINAERNPHLQANFLQYNTAQDR